MSLCTVSRCILPFQTRSTCHHCPAPVAPRIRVLKLHVYVLGCLGDPTQSLHKPAPKMGFVWFCCLQRVCATALAKDHRFTCAAYTWCLPRFPGKNGGNLKCSRKCSHFTTLGSLGVRLQGLSRSIHVNTCSVDLSGTCFKNSCSASSKYPRNISKYHEPHKCVQPNLAQRATTFKKATTGHFETCLRLHDLIEFLMPEGQRSTHSWSLVQGPFSLQHTSTKHIE